MKSKMRLIIEIIIVISILVLSSIIVINVVSVDKKANEEKNTKDLIENLNKLLINGGSKEEIIELTGLDDVDETSLMTGKDCYMRTRPDDKTIKDNNLDNYVIIQDELSSNVEKKIQSNFYYSIDDVQEEDDYTQYSVLLKSYYQIAYLLDLEELQKQLLAKSGLEESEVNNYKAKVIALKILNERLDDYVNNDENCMANLYRYKNDKERNDSSLLSYINLLQGLNYHNEKVFTENQLNITERINTYINVAIENKLINESVLEL